MRNCTQVLWPVRPPHSGGGFCSAGRGRGPIKRPKPSARKPRSRARTSITAAMPKLVVTLVSIVCYTPSWLFHERLDVALQLSHIVLSNMVLFSQLDFSLCITE